MEWTADLPCALRTPESASEARLSYLGSSGSAGALQRLCAADPGRYQLVLAGGDEVRVSSREGADRRGIRYTPLPDQECGLGLLETVRSGVDIAVYPSIAQESCGLVFAEAMGSGCRNCYPVIMHFERSQAPGTAG